MGAARSSLKRLAGETAARLGLPRLLHWAFLQGRLTILLYHAVVSRTLEVGDWCFLEEDAFCRQADYLARHFEVVSLSEGVARMRRGELDGPTAVITLDDGFQRTSEATLEWRGSRFDLAGSQAKARAAAVLQSRLKALAYPLLWSELSSMIQALGDDPRAPIETGSPYRMLSPDAVAEMAASGLVEFGAHAHTHSILSLLAPEEQQEEIQRSLAAVQALTGRRCTWFAYPNGRMGDYDARVIGMLEASGVGAAVTTIAGPNDARTPVLELKRYGIGPDSTMARFQLMVHHVSGRGR